MIFLSCLLSYDYYSHLVLAQFAIAVNQRLLTTPIGERMVEFADQIGKSIQLLYFPPYHSKYNPIERCWGILEQHWNGALLSHVETMLVWAESMTRIGKPPLVHLSQEIYQKGISLTKKARGSN